MANSQKTFELGRMDIVDIYEWLEGGKIITGPIFQRLSVWKDKDREELIDTIMNGYPIPAIFICEGQTNNSEIGKKYVVLDGKQRLESISKFLKNEITYNGKTFGEFESDDKSKFLNFSLPIVQMYIDVNEDLDKVQEIFKRLNKNSYNLNEIEKSLAQYIDYDFINICKILCSFIEVNTPENEFDIEDIENSEENIETEKIIKSDYNELYFIENYIQVYFTSNDMSYIKKIFTDKRFFTPHEQTRQKSIQHLINILGYLIKQEHISRNVKGIEYEVYSEKEFILKSLFPIIERLNIASKKFLELFNILEKEDIKSLRRFWFSKSNLYTFIILFYKYDISDINKLKNKLLSFAVTENISQDFKDYRFACKEDVNSKKIRVLREDILIKILNLN